VTWSKTEQQHDWGQCGVAAPLIDRKGRCKGLVGAPMPMTACGSSPRMLDAV
jgi:DNA-binding IclR family transcriptional regulator